MPAQYEAIRDSLLKKGTDLKEAKRIAAATYNKTHKKNPVTRATPAKEGKKPLRTNPFKGVK